jgi:hypothetical protein
MADEVKSKKSRKLSKVLVGTVLTITESVTGNVLTFDAAKLPAAIQANLMPYGLSQKLGDAAAGRSGQEAINAIQKVYDGLAKGDWSTRVPAVEKVNKKSILDKVAALSPKEQEVARGLLEKLGFFGPAKK